MEKTIIKSDVMQIEKQKFHHHKRPISIKNIDINQTMVSNKVSFFSVYKKMANKY